MTSSARIAALSAVGMSLVAVICMIIYLPMLWNKIDRISLRLNSDMREFRLSMVALFAVRLGCVA